MLLVDDDQSDVFHRREQSAARTDHHARFAAFHEIPLIIALPPAHTRVHDRHRIAEATAKSRDRLRREGDLGNEHNGVASASKHALDRLQVHLGFTGAGDAVDQHDLPLRALDARVHDRKRFGLTCGKTGLRRESRTYALLARQRRASHPPSPLDTHDPLRLKGLHRGGNRAELEGELRHAQIAPTQSLDDRSLLDRVLARGEIFGGGSQRHPAIVNLPHRRLLEAP